MRIIYEQDKYRIVELQDEDVDLENLKGDCYSPKHNPEIDANILAEDEYNFESLVRHEGVFGYELQRWNPKVDAGWEHLDSCHGFVGQYSEEPIFKHYIVDEMKSMIADYVSTRIKENLK